MFESGFDIGSIASNINLDSFLDSVNLNIDLNDLNFSDFNSIATGDMFDFTGSIINYLDDDLQLDEQLTSFVESARDSVVNANLDTLLVDPSGGLLLVDMAARSPLGDLVEHATGQSPSEALDHLVGELQPEKVFEGVKEVADTAGQELANFGQNLLGAALMPITALTDTVNDSISSTLQRFKPYLIGGVLLLVAGGVVYYQTQKPQKMPSQTQPNNLLLENLGV
jgi:hypothetical protein